MSDKRTLNARTFFAFGFLGLMSVLGFSAVFAYWQTHFAEDPETAVRTDVPAVDSFKEIYRFDADEDNGSIQKPAAEEKLNIISAYCKTVTGVKDAANRYLTIRSLVSAPFYSLVNGLDEFSGNNFIENGDEPIVRLPNGYFAYVLSYSSFPESWTEVRDWALWLKERDISLLCLLPATKSDDSVTVFPPVSHYEYAQTAGEYKAYLTENHIIYIDAKDYLLAENSDFYSWFYKADHHWNVFAGRMIAEVTAQKLRDELNINTDPEAVKEDNFALTFYPSIFRGSIARRLKSKLEDFEVFYQRKESSFRLKIPSMGIDRTGGFNDTLIAKQYLKSGGAYRVFLYGNLPLIQVENKTCTNGTRVLVIKHSQGNIVCPYLACAVQYLDIIDSREFDGNIKAFIEETRPDAVLVCI